MVPNSIPPIDGSSYKLMDSLILREIIITWYDMIKTYSQMQRTDKFSHHSSTISPVWLNGWVFGHKLIGYGFESRCFPETLKSGVGVTYLKLEFDFKD